MSIKRHRFFVLACTFATAILGCGYLWHTPPQYNSVASLHIQPEQDTRPGLEAAGTDLEALADRVRSYIVLSMALSAPDLHDLPELQGQSSPIEFVKARLRVATSDSASELRLSFTSTSPSEARAILDAIATAFVRASNAHQLQTNYVAVSIVNPAETLASVVWPKPLPVLMVAALLGLILGSVLAAIWDVLSPQPLDPDDASMTVQSPLLGCVPQLPANLTSAALRGQSVVLAKSTSALAKSWSQIRTALDSAFVANFDKTILVTASGKARGKTLVASNIAIAMAQAGHRVVLIDGHPDRSAIGEIFGTQNSTGLGDAIEGRIHLADALKVTGLPELEVLPAGNAKSTWRQLFNSQNFMDVLGELSERFDRVVIDGGPASSDECRILGAHCDIAVLLADARIGSRRELRSAAADLRMVGARVAGIVWNHSPRDSIAPLRTIAQIKDWETATSTSSEKGSAESARRASEDRMETALLPHL